MKALIETERLLLRRITLKDKEDLFKLHSDPAVQRFTGEPLIETIEEMEQVIRTRIPNYDRYGYGRWITFLKDEMQFVGWAGLAYLPEFDEIDLGYRFLPKYWGMGIATEASIKVMEKVGMKFDKYAPYDPGGEDVAWYYCDEGGIEGAT